MFPDPVAETNESRAPELEIVGVSAQVVGTVSGSGSPWVFPVCSSIRTFQRFMLPPLSLAKYKASPVGDQIGHQSTAGSDVTRTAADPEGRTVQTSRCPPVFAQ